jgi:Flp pilus assembly CpaF family ATPase
MLNCDGGLWADHRGRGMHKIGTMSAGNAAIFVSVVARSLGILVTQKNAIIEGDLPFGSFIGILPPIVDNPSFTIRKRKHC